MISFLKNCILTSVIFIFGSLAPLFPAFAQSEALKSAFEEASDSVQKDSAEVALQKIVGFLKVQVSNLEESLLELEDLSEIYKEKKKAFLEFLSEAANYLDSLEINGDNVKTVVIDINSWREEVYNPNITEVVNFLLVIQSESFLEIASARFVKIRSDIKKLADLKILEKNKVQPLINESGLLLIGAGELIVKAQNQFLASVEERDSDLEIRNLISGALTKLKEAYKRFLDIGLLVKASI